MREARLLSHGNECQVAGTMSKILSSGKKSVTESRSAESNQQVVFFRFSCSGNDTFAKAAHERL